MVSWTADKDQIILKGIFVFHDIKNSGPLLDYLAKEIGDGCTPKAVSHRLTNLRKSGKTVNSTSTPKKSTATAVRTPRTPASGGRGRARPPAKKAADSDATSNEDEDEDGEEKIVPSPSMNRKRARTSKAPTSYMESSATSGDDVDEEEFTPVKKVKKEPVEEEGVISGEAAAGQEDMDDEGVAFV